MQQQNGRFSSGLARDQPRVDSSQLQDALAVKRVVTEKAGVYEQVVKDCSAVEVANGIRRFVTFCRVIFRRSRLFD